MLILSIVIFKYDYSFYSFVLACMNVQYLHNTAHFIFYFIFILHFVNLELLQSYKNDQNAVLSYSFF